MAFADRHAAPFATDRNHSVRCFTMGGGQKRKKGEQKRREDAPAKIVVDLRFDLRGLTVQAADTNRTPTTAHHAHEDLHLDVTDGAPDATTAEPIPLGPSWPLGPHYLRSVEGKGAAAWARFKLHAADWYLEALEDAERKVGLDRFVGVEMAIDGVLASLCAGVDAAAEALVDEIERLVGPTAARAHRRASGDWTVLVAVAQAANFALGSARALEHAVRRDEEGTSGWLTELQRLQSLTLRRNVLVRRPNVAGADRSRLLDVPGLGPRPVLRYLQKARRRTDGLVEILLTDLDDLTDEAQKRRSRSGPPRAGLPDLSARAGLLGPRRHGFDAH